MPTNGNHIHHHPVVGLCPNNGNSFFRYWPSVVHRQASHRCQAGIIQRAVKLNSSQTSSRSFAAYGDMSDSAELLELYSEVVL